MAASSNRDALDSLLVESIDEILAELLGTCNREAVYDHLERNLSIDRKDIAQHLDALQSLLDRNFGKGGKVIGRSIARRLYSKVDRKFTAVAGFELADYFVRLREGIARELTNRRNP